MKFSIKILEFLNYVKNPIKKRLILQLIGINLEKIVRTNNA